MKPTFLRYPEFIEGSVLPVAAVYDRRVAVALRATDRRWDSGGYLKYPAASRGLRPPGQHTHVWRCHVTQVARDLRARDRRPEVDGYQLRRRWMSWAFPNRWRATRKVNL